MESRLEIAVVPWKAASSTDAPLSRKAFAPSRMPLTERLPALRSPEGWLMAKPTEVNCPPKPPERPEVTGITPGCSANRSV